MADEMKPEAVAQRPTLNDGSIDYGGGVVGASPRDIKEVNTLKDFAKNEQGGIDPKVAAGVAVGAGLLGVGGYVLTHQESTPPAVVATGEPATASNTLKTPSGTVEITVNPPTPPATPTSPQETPKQAEKPVDCGVLTPEQCAQGELISYRTPQGQEIKYIGWNLPVGTELKSPIDGVQFGKVQINQPSPFQGILLSVGPSDRSSNYNFTGDFKTPDSISVQTGKVLGTIGNTNAKEFGQYNLVFTITRIDPTTKLPTTDEEALKKMFPRAFDKPAKTVSYTGPTSGTVTAPEYYNNKP